MLRCMISTTSKGRNIFVRCVLFYVAIWKIKWVSAHEIVHGNVYLKNVRPPLELLGLVYELRFFIFSMECCTFLLLFLFSFPFFIAVCCTRYRFGTILSVSDPIASYKLNNNEILGTGGSVGNKSGQRAL